MRFTFTAVCLIGVATILNACSSGDSASDSESDASEVSAEFEAAAQTTAVDSLLTLTDFPEGWTQTPKDPNEPQLGLAGDCAVLEADGLPGDIAHAESDDFIGPGHQEVSTGTSVFANATVGEQAFDAYTSTFSACRSEFTARYEELLREGFTAEGIPTESISDLAISLDPMESAVDADDSIAYRLVTAVTAQRQALEFTYDVSVIRKGKVLGYVSYYSRGQPSEAEEATLVLALEAKLRAADASLSDGS